MPKVVCRVTPAGVRQSSALSFRLAPIHPVLRIGPRGFARCHASLCAISLSCVFLCVFFRGIQNLDELSCTRLVLTLPFVVYFCRSVDV